MAGTCRHIHAACEAGNTEKVERFIRTGVDVNKKDECGNTPIHWAAMSGNNDIVNLLIVVILWINLNNFYISITAIVIKMILCFFIIFASFMHSCDDKS